MSLFARTITTPKLESNMLQVDLRVDSCYAPDYAVIVLLTLALL